MTYPVSKEQFEATTSEARDVIVEGNQIAGILLRFAAGELTLTLDAQREHRERLEYLGNRLEVLTLRLMSYRNLSD